MDNIDDKNILVLAYIGDAYYELYVRNYLIKNNNLRVQDLQKNSIKYVSAKGQALFLNYLTINNILSESELDIVKRGRNYKRGFHPKNTDILTYKHSTGFEALIGYLYLNNNIDRLDEILEYLKEL